jgi:trimethylamine--corrinoid protein Co-methyltransferase
MARRKRIRTPPSLGFTQNPWGQSVNRFGPLALASEDEIEALHDASMSLLENTGVEVMSDTARNLFKDAGASVDMSSNRVRLDREMVTEFVTRAPSSFTLHARNPEHDIRVGEGHLSFTPATTPPFCSDLDRGRRAGNFDDFSNLLRLCQSLNSVHLLTGYPVEPQDLPVHTRHLDC